MKTEVDLRLSVLCAIAPPGHIFTQVELADQIGCTHQYINLIEKTALRKLKKAAKSHQLKDWSEGLFVKEKRKHSIAEYAKIEGVNKLALGSATRRNPHMTVEECAQKIRDNRK